MRAYWRMLGISWKDHRTNEAILEEMSVASYAHHAHLNSEKEMSRVLSDQVHSLNLTQMHGIRLCLWTSKTTLLVSHAKYSIQIRWDDWWVVSTNIMQLYSNTIPLVYVSWVLAIYSFGAGASFKLMFSTFIREYGSTFMSFHHHKKINK